MKRKTKPCEGAQRAALAISAMLRAKKLHAVEDIADIITRESGLPEAMEALAAAASFIENVTFDDPRRDDRFFKVREQWRNAFAKTGGLT
ncbi:MAG: hypothetical protein ABFE07_28105 [Armatimonadia bacterium]